MALNTTASAVWEAIETPRTIDEICGLLTRKFVVAEPEARPAVFQLIEAWRAQGLVRNLG